MNRTEWESCNDPLVMLHWLRGRGSDRKFRLFACACVRRIELVLKYFGLEGDADVVNAEQQADGLPPVLTVPYRGLWTATEDQRILARGILECLADEEAWSTASVAVSMIRQLLPTRWGARPETALAAEITGDGRGQADVLRDLFGHLFHDSPRWMAELTRSDEVERLAAAIYKDRTFAELPVLGDALEDAGCTDEAVLEHCRTGGEHYRGCWVVDVILART